MNRCPFCTLKFIAFLFTGWTNRHDLEFLDPHHAIGVRSLQPLERHFAVN